VKPPRLNVRVETAPEPIDLNAWAKNYVREVLRIEGYTVSSVPASSEPPPFAEVG
jgi:hypothetical protein